MNQTEVEIESIKALVKYNNLLKMVLDVGICAQESLIDFYKKSNGALLLSDRRCKKIIEENSKVLNAIQEYYAETSDNIKIIMSDFNEILKIIEEKDNTSSD